MLFWLLTQSSAIFFEPPEKESEARLSRITYTSQKDGKERDCIVYLPKGYDNSQKEWPVMLFLHGNGSRGNGKSDLKWLFKHGPLMEAWIQKRDLPFIIVAPQLHMFGRDTVLSYIANRDSTTIPKRQEKGTPARIPLSDVSDKTPDIGNGLPYGITGNVYGWHMVEEDLKYLINKVQDDYRGDAKRTYLTGLSYGGYGTWYIGSKHTDVFAAIAPIAGWGHPEVVQNLCEASTPIWCFAGQKDGIVLLSYFNPAMRKLEECQHPDFHFSIEENTGHDVWKRIYQQDTLYSWLLSKEKP